MMTSSLADCHAHPAVRRALDKAFFSVLACAIQDESAAGAAGTDRRLRDAAELLAKLG